MKRTKKKGTDRGKAPEIGQPQSVTPAQNSPSIFVTSDEAKSQIWGIYSRPANSDRPFKVFAIVDTRQAAITHAQKIQKAACLGQDLAVIGADDEKSIPAEFTENSVLRPLET